MFTKRLIVFTLFYFSGVLGEKKLCDFSDEKCLTTATNRQFKEFIAGIPGKVEPSDPLYREYIEANLPTVHYKIFKGYLRGMRNCEVELVKILEKDAKYEYHIGCPHLPFEAEYELDGELGPHHVEGKGTCTVDHYDYHFLFSGDVDKITGPDGELHIQMKTHKLDIDARGKVVYNFGNLFDGDKEKSDEVHKYANENWKDVDKVLRGPAFDSFMNKYIDNCNTWLKLVPVKDLFYQ